MPSGIFWHVSSISFTQATIFIIYRHVWAQQWWWRSDAVEKPSCVLQQNSVAREWYSLTLFLQLDGNTMQIADTLWRVMLRGRSEATDKRGVRVRFFSLQFLKFSPLSRRFSAFCVNYTHPLCAWELHYGRNIHTLYVPENCITVEIYTPFMCLIIALRPKVYSCSFMCLTQKLKTEPLCLPKVSTFPLFTTRCRDTSPEA